ncbi:DUF7344 domain-containing protein [Halovivax limisalsi]|uniref:DUF7344 domain-containing protein n=1 Tax=Halovivax limisalsi TaxID=1453760 RepID=UPI001FFC44BC|nr:hypothetical protein [Halovivax limisalsi]
MESFPQQEDAEQLTADTILELLANRRRRYLLYALRGRTEPVELSRLAETVAGWEHNVPPDEVAQNDYKSVYVSSVQCHVPKLAEAGVVEHDTDDHSVILSDTFEQLEPYLEVVVQDEPENSTLQRALGAETHEGLLGSIRQNVAKLKQ